MRIGSLKRTKNMFLAGRSLARHATRNPLKNPNFFMERAKDPARRNTRIYPTVLT
ncbi:MAG: hypothetical protein RI894_971 [Bacteroidota bacterium]|jgi:hypothetical protein